jgi:aminoglycoside phosphotransferase (APT) family kinase protein
MTGPDDPLTAILRAYPDLAGAGVIRHDGGWDSVAFDIGDAWIFKVPRHALAEVGLRREASLLAMLRGRVSLPIPDMTLHEGPPVFSAHPKLVGVQVPPDVYAGLAEDVRDRLADSLGRFFTDLHAIPTDTAIAAGAQPVQPWMHPSDIARLALPLLPQALHRKAQAALDAYARLPPDPFGDIYGFFDGHVWNMAFDAEQGVLTGIYDFADSGIGPLHREFVYPSLVSPDLTRRVMAAYARHAGRTPDRARIALLTTVHRLWELAGAADAPDHRPAMCANVESWLAAWSGPEQADPL